MNRRQVIPATLAVLLVAWTFVPAGAAPAENLEKQFLAQIDELLPGMGAEKIEDREQPQLTFERICFANSGPDKQTERAALCSAMMQRVGPDVAMPARVWLLRKVEPIGREEVVARLTELLSDPEPRIRELARRALANNPADQAAAALRAELANAEDAAWKVTLINALAWRHDKAAVAPISKRTRDDDAAVAAAAISAMGRIPDDYAVETLAYLRKHVRAELRDQVMDSSIEAAESLLARGARERAAGIYEEVYAVAASGPARITALQGLTAAKGADALPELMKLILSTDERMQLVAARCAQSIPGGNVTERLAGALATASPQAQAVLLEMLGKRGDAAALPAVVKYFDASDPDVRIAAVGALRYIGNGSSVEPLARLAARSTGPERDAARDSLKWVQGKDVNDAILQQVRTTTDDRVRAELARAAAVRLMKPALNILLQNVADPDESVRVPIIYNIGKLATPEDLPRVLRAFARLEADQPHDIAKQALVRICSRISDPEQKAQPLAEALNRAEPMLKIIILETLSELRGQVALEAIRGAIQSTDPRVKEAAGKALGAWGPIYCREWVFSGPYKKSGASHTDLYNESFPPEDAGSSVDFKPLKHKGGQKINLEKISKDENCCAYMRSQITSAKKQEAVLTFGSDDGIKVWLNGKMIHGNNATRGFKANEDQVPVTLKKGANTILVKVTQGGGDWAFACGVKAPDGGPPDSIKFEAR